MPPTPREPSADGASTVHSVERKKPWVARWTTFERGASALNAASVALLPVSIVTSLLDQWLAMASTSDADPGSGAKRVDRKSPQPLRAPRKLATSRVSPTAEPTDAELASVSVCRPPEGDRPSPIPEGHREIET